MTPAKRNIQIKKLIDGKSLKELRRYFEEKKNTELEEYYNKIRKLIDIQYSKSLKVSSIVNMVKYHKDIFDYEILCDCIIDVIGTINQTESMMKWDPYPFNDEGTKYRLYKKHRFNKTTGISQDVSDDIIIELLKGDVEAKPPTKPDKIETEEDYSGCTKAQLAYIELFNLTNDHIDHYPKTDDGKKMSITKAVKIVYDNNKKLFPEWADSSLKKLYYKGEELTISHM